MYLRLTRLMLVVLVMLAASQAARADQESDRKAIEEQAQAYAAAFNARDAEALASHWTADAIYTNPLTGVQVSGRSAIEEQYKSLFASEGTAKLEVLVESIEFFSPSVAVEQGVAILQREGESPTHAPYSAVHLKQNGTWLLDRLSEEELPPAPRSNYEQLQKLEWLVGRWEDAQGGERVTTNCQWTRNRNFLHRSFAVRVEGEVELSGMQFIGWDPNSEQVRSWTLDSDGGFAEGRWTETEDGWHVSRSATLPEGGHASSVEIIRPIDNDQISWRSINRMHRGKPLPSSDEVIVVRAAPQ